MLYLYLWQDFVSKASGAPAIDTFPYEESSIDLNGWLYAGSLQALRSGQLHSLIGLSLDLPT